jgi:hypothetical protein
VLFLGLGRGCYGEKGALHGGSLLQVSPAGRVLSCRVGGSDAAVLLAIV